MDVPYSRPTLLLNGVDYTDYLVPTSLLYQSLVQQGVVTQLQYDFKNVPSSFSVEGGQLVELYLKGQSAPYFIGYQTRSVPKRYAPQSWAYQCRASGVEQVFYRKQCFMAFRGLTFAGAIQQILSDPDQTYPSNLLQSVSDPNALLSEDMPFYAANGAYPADLFNLIASLSNTTWRIVRSGSNFQLEFFDPFNTYNGFTLTQNNKSFKWGSFQPVIDLEGVVNTQSVRGSQVALETPEQAYFRRDGLSSKFDLPTQPFNNTASVVLFDSFNSSPISTANWFESDVSGNHVWADGSGFVQYDSGVNAWTGLISHSLASRASGCMSTIDINWVTNGIALWGLTALDDVPSDATQFLEAGVYVDASGNVYGIAGGVSMGFSGLTLSTGQQYRFRMTCKASGGCSIEYQAGSDIYTRNWTLAGESDNGQASSLSTAIYSYSAGLSLAMVKTVYPYLGVELQVDRGSGFASEEVGIYPIDEDVDAVIMEDSVLAFFGSDPGPSTIPPAPSWQNDSDYKNIQVTYRRGVNIFATYRDSDSVAAIATLFGGSDSGIREGQIVYDSSITSYQAALAKAKNMVDNQSSVVSQITAQTSVNILSDASVPLPVTGELSRFSITLPTTSYVMSRDIPIRKIKIQGLDGLNDLTLTVEAGYLKRGLRTVLEELTKTGKLISINENQVIYSGRSVSDTLTLSEAVTSFGAGNTRRWGDSRLNVFFTVNTSTDLLTTSASTKYVTGDDVQVSSSGTLPTGLSANTVYYINKQSTTTYYLYDTLAHAQAGGSTGRIDLTSTGSGTHTLMPNAWKWGNHKWSSFVDTVLRAEAVMKVTGNVSKRLVLSGEFVMNVRAKVNGV